MSATDTSRTAKMLERVRALLAKADGTNFPAEADSFRAKADELMTAYAIEQWQVDQAQEGTNRTAAPEKREFNFDWWYNSSFRSELWSIFNAAARHCRCVVATRGQSYKAMPVIGIPSDLDYFDMLFTHLMLDMAKQLEPKPDPGKTFGENAYALRAAGVQRVRVIELLYKAGMIPGTDPEAYPWEEIYRGEPGRNGYFREMPGMPKDKQLRAKVRVAAEKHAKDNGLDSTTQDAPAVWQRGFAQGFAREVSHRFQKMRGEQEATGGETMALAVRDIYDQAVALYDELFPKPEVPRCKEEGCDNVAIYSGYCREHAEAHGIRIPKGRAMAKPRDVAFSSRAYSAGTAAGKRANLNANPNRGVGGKRGELGS